MDDAAKVQNAPLESELSKTRSDGTLSPEICQDPIADVPGKQSKTSENTSGRRTMKTIVIPDYIEDDYDTETVKFELGGEPILLLNQSGQPIGEYRTDDQKRAESREKLNNEDSTFSSNLRSSPRMLSSETCVEMTSQHESRDDHNNTSKSTSSLQGQLEPVKLSESKNGSANFPETLAARRNYLEDSSSQRSQSSANQPVSEKEERTEYESKTKDDQNEIENSKLENFSKGAKEKETNVKDEPFGAVDVSLADEKLSKSKSRHGIVDSGDEFKSCDDGLHRSDVTTAESGNADAARANVTFPCEIKSLVHFLSLNDSDGNVDIDSVTKPEQILTKILEDGMPSVHGVTDRSAKVSGIIDSEPVQKEPEVTFKVWPQLTDHEDKEGECYDSGLDESTQIKENGVASQLSSDLHSTPKKGSGLQNEIRITKSTESSPSKPFHKKDLQNEATSIRSTESSPSTPLHRKDKKTAIADKTADISRCAKSTHAKNKKLSSSGGNSEDKKVPMNKIQVATSPSPNLKVVKSKIGSLEYSSYKPGGGSVKIASEKLQWQAKSKVGSLDNASYKPGGGDIKIDKQKLNFQNAHSKVASTTNIKHKPGGGLVKIESRKLELKVQSKVGSLDNVKHRPGGGEKKIFEDKEYLRNIERHHHPRDDKSDEDKHSRKQVCSS